jgi:hypothetical protein
MIDQPGKRDEQHQDHDYNQDPEFCRRVIAPF